MFKRIKWTKCSNASNEQNVQKPQKHPENAIPRTVWWRLKILSETKIFKRTEHFLIHHLCWVDLLMLTLNGCFNFYSLYQRYIKYVNTCWLKDLRNNFAYSFLLFSNWPFGKYYCQISNFISLSTVSASTLTLTAITFQR